MRFGIAVTGLMVALMMPAIAVPIAFGAIEAPDFVLAILIAAGVSGGVTWGCYFYPFAAFYEYPPDPAKVSAVQESGRARYMARTTGRLSKAGMTLPLLTVALHRGGIVIRPVALLPLALPWEEVVDVQRVRSGVEIHHTSKEIESPIVVTGRTGDEILGAFTRRDTRPA